MKDKVKIRFNLQGNPINGETIWAEPVGKDLYRLLNIPYYAIGYAEGDIVHCVERGDWKEVINLEQDGGNGAIRIVFADSESPEAQHILDELVSVGCTYERASSELVAVTVPPNLDIPFSQMANYLNSADDKILVGWEVGKNLTRM